jgi:hypothetical protein
MSWLASGQGLAAKAQFEAKGHDAMTVDSATPIRRASLVRAALLLA